MSAPERRRPLSLARQSDELRQALIGARTDAELADLLEQHVLPTAHMRVLTELLVSAIARLRRSPAGAFRLPSESGPLPSDP